MDEKNIKPLARERDFNPKSRKLIYLIHGFTGSPTDFNQLPDYLEKKIGAHVRIPLIKGHGTKIEDLNKADYNEMTNEIEKDFKKHFSNSDSVIIVGFSLGALIALDLASRYKLNGVIAVSPVYKYKFPANIASLIYKILPLNKWKKSSTFIELRMRQNAFRYDYVHKNGFKLVNQAKKQLENYYDKVNCPVLLIHSSADNLVKEKSLEIIAGKLKNSKTEIVKLSQMSKIEHNLFYTKQHLETYNLIIDFCRRLI